MGIFHDFYHLHRVKWHSSDGENLGLEVRSRAGRAVRGAGPERYRCPWGADAVLWSDLGLFFFFLKISPGNIQGLSFQQKIRDPTKNIQQKRWFKCYFIIRHGDLPAKTGHIITSFDQEKTDLLRNSSLETLISAESTDGLRGNFVGNVGKHAIFSEVDS